MERGDVVECLHCGHLRATVSRDPGECPRCRYLGWAYAGQLDEGARRRLRELSTAARGTGAAAGRARIDSAA